MQLGDQVRVRPPFDVALPDEYVIEAVNSETGAWQIAGGIDFDESNLEAIT